MKKLFAPHSRVLVLFLVVFFITAYSSRTFGVKHYDPFANFQSGQDKNLTGQMEITIQKPIGGLIQYELSHPYWTPAILLNNNEVNGNNIVSHLQWGEIYAAVLPYWILLSITFAVMLNSLLKRKYER